jgi:membrane protein DedA with SNARE-associated domain
MPQVFQSIVDAVSGSNWSYLIVFAIAMIDAFFPLVPSEATAIAAGVVAGTGGLRVELVILAAALGAIAGDNICFFAGHFLGERLNQRFFQGEKNKKTGSLGEKDARGTRRLHHRRRALHTRRQNGGYLHGRLRRRDALATVHSATTSSPA